MWQVAPCLYVGVPVHSARSHSRLLFGLFLFKHPGLTLHCPSLTSPLRLGVERAPWRGRMGWLLLKDWEKRGKGPHIPLFSLLKTGFAP